jgi:hypothetical protein
MFSETVVAVRTLMRCRGLQPGTTYWSNTIFANFRVRKALSQMCRAARRHGVRQRGYGPSADHAKGVEEADDADERRG